MKVLLATMLLLVHWTGTPVAGGPDKSWWQSLTSDDGVPCCDIADGQKVLDVDWGTYADAKGKVHFQVRLENRWVHVPDSAVVKVANRFGPAVVWPYTDETGVVHVRCFLPGAGA